MKQQRNRMRIDATTGTTTPTAMGTTLERCPGKGVWMTLSALLAPVAEDEPEDEPVTGTVSVTIDVMTVAPPPVDPRGDVMVSVEGFKEIVDVIDVVESAELGNGISAQKVCVAALSAAVTVVKRSKTGEVMSSGITVVDWVRIEKSLLACR